MFTGIIEELAEIVGLEKRGDGTRLFVKSAICVSDAKTGDSISVNGACLTIVAIKKDVITFDVSSETLARTVLGDLKPKALVNLERSLKADSRLGGHFVTGHVDAVGKIVSKKIKGEFIVLEVEIPKDLAAYFVEKGSVCVDGISLTVNNAAKDKFSALLIPHTITVTTLGSKESGDEVNIEADILAKYAKRSIAGPAEKFTAKTSSITKGLLKEHGFI